MLNFQLDETESILVISPQGPLATADFQALSSEVDSCLERTGSLRGLLIETDPFPGWEGFSGLTVHLRFDRDHHRALRRVDLVSDGAVISYLPGLASHFVAAEVGHFPAAKRDCARGWLLAA